MLTDAKPTGYTYADAASVLRGLGFELAPSSGGSDRKWRGLAPGGERVYVGLVESGSGRLKAYLIRDMVRMLREANLIPEGLDSPDAVDH